MRVEQLISRKGNPVANHFLIHDYENHDTYFQSYNSIILKIDESGMVVLDKDYWDYSKTTGKYRNQVLGENKAETEKKLKEGVYQFGSLNP